MSFSGSRPTTGASTSLRARALSRSLEGVRGRSEERLQRLLDVARQIIMDSPDSDFTVAEVADRAGISLKTVYRCFAGKDELLLALLEEECQLGAVLLSHGLDSHTSATERLRACATVLFSLAEEEPDYARFIYRQHQRLSVDHREEVARAVSPMVGVIETQIRKAEELDLARVGDPLRAAQLVFCLLIDGLSVFTSSSQADAAEVEAISRFISAGLRLDVEVTSHEEGNDGHR